MNRVLYFFFLFPTIAFSQTYFSQTEFDIGEIVQLNQDVIDLNLSNQGDDDVYILRIDAHSRISIKYTSKTLSVGSAQLLRVKLNPTQTGKFKERIKVYLSSNTQPILLTFKGVVKTLPQNNKTACPDFSGGQKAQINYQLFKEQHQGEKNQYFVEVLSKEQNSIHQDVNEVHNSTDLSEQIVIKEKIERNRKTPEERRNSQSVLQILFGKNESDLDQENNEELKENKEEYIIDSLPKDNTNLLSKDFKPNNVVFLIDASTSMKEEGRMQILKLAMIQLLEPLRPIDYLSIVTYSGDAKVLLPPTAANKKEEIKRVIENIVADGSTHAAKGIKKAIQIGQSSFIEGGNNQIILATDGAFEIGRRNESLRRKIKKTAKEGLTVSVIGIKNANWTKKSLKEIVELGEGSFIKIKSEKEASKVLEEVKKKAKN